MTKLYLDIDGVLVTNKNTRAADDVQPFLKFVTENFDCYWLTTHCKDDARMTFKYVVEYIPYSACFLRKIKPTNWNTLKTEAIDFESDFYWLDDYPMLSEKLILKQKGKESNLIVVDLNRPNELKCIMEHLIKINQYGH